MAYVKWLFALVTRVHHRNHDCSYQQGDSTFGRCGRGGWAFLVFDEDDANSLTCHVIVSVLVIVSCTVLGLRRAHEVILLVTVAIQSMHISKSN